MLQLMLLCGLLFGAGWVFGRWLLPLPVMMSLLPFIWHLNLQSHTLRVAGLMDRYFWVYIILACGLGILLLCIGIAWEHSYPMSLYLFPLLCFVVYMAPWQYLRINSPLTLEPSFDTLLFFSVAAALAILSYLLPMFLKLIPTPTTQPPTLEGRLPTNLG
jgi:hypothetical protein